MSLVFVAGCKEKTKPKPLTTEQIHGITREFVSAARNATQGRAQIDTHSENVKSQSSGSRAADDIFVSLPRTKAGVPDHEAYDAILKEFARVADSYHLTRVTKTESPGLERFDYLEAGRRTHSIHLITLAPKSETAVTALTHPRLAIVIDDLGTDRAQAAVLFRLSYPLTVSVLPNHAESREIAEEAHRRGFEVMLHLPVASNAGDKDEPVELHPGMDTRAVEKTFSSMLNSVPYAAGVNNHEGSLGTSDQKLMDELMPVLHQHQLFFIDSRTTAATVAETAAHAANVPAARRNVFLDDDQSAGAIRKQFVLALRDAREKGSALAIGHPHPETLQVLTEMLPSAKKQGVTLVFASDLVR